ncbi:MAG: sodium:solute symporter [Wenzhouxiangellaceae bacterium]|nr:sodium:solute symporter [Wenzhouxiangellaceae bacterium]
MPEINLHPVDIAIVLFYFAAMIALGLFLSRRIHNADDYFLAGRHMIWPLIGFSLFASNISSTTLVGLSGEAYATGISIYNYEWMAAIVLVIFAVFFLPVLLRRRTYTMPEFLARRFDERIRTYFSSLTLFLSVVVETAGSLFAGALVIQMVFPDVPLWQTMTALAVIAGIYTLAGGLAAVMITDVVQALLLLLGSLVIAWTAFDQVGGLGAVFEQLDPDRLSLIRPLNDPTMPWLGLITGVPLLGFYYWATNQAIVQRVLAAKDVHHGRMGALFAGALKLAPLFIMVLPGSAAILLYPELENSDQVYPMLMFDLLPVGLLGLVLAGFVAAIMSQIDSALNSASTLVTMDFVRRRWPDLDGHQLMIIGRVVMALFLVFAVLWAPFITQFRSIFSYLQTMFSYAVPPVVALFLVGVFWPRANSAGAFASIVVGVVAGVAGFVAIELLDWFELHFLYVAPILFLLCATTLITVSLRTPPPNAEAISDYLWRASDFHAETAELRGLAWYRNYRILAGLLLLATAALVIAFW